MRLYIDGDLAWTGNTAEYICGARDFIEMITFGSTLMPGDVITLGRVGALVKIPAGKRNGSHHAIRLEVESMPAVTCTVY
jgi:2-keto-4-pentenoate hydratase/2-oxohepta-3-ene-1,7-dioic acid hydratase in catechol pathway